MQLVLVMRDLEPGLMPAWDLTGIQSGREVSGPAWPGHKQGSEVQVQLAAPCASSQPAEGLQVTS